MALIDIDFRNKNSDQIMASLRRRQYLWPVLSVVVTLSLTAALLSVLPALAAYATVFGVALARIALFARGQNQAAEQLRLSLETTTEFNALLSDRERTNREIADEAVQSLYGAAMRLDSCLDRLQDETGVREDVDAAAEQLTEVIDQIRRYVLELQPVQVDSTKLRSVPQYEAHQDALSAVGMTND